MNFGQSFRLAIKSLLSSKMRALLTMLGIIIGVAAVIVIVSLGNGMQTMMNEQFSKLGANLIQVQVMGRGSSRAIEPDDMYALAAKYPQYLTGASPYVQSRTVLRHDGEDYTRTSILGVSEAYFSMTTVDLAEGRYLQYIDVARSQNVCLVGSYLNETAYKGNAIGKTISVAGVPYTIVGVLAETGDSAEGSADDQLYIPYTNALHLNGDSQVTMYMLTCKGSESAAAAKGIVENRLFKTFQSSDYYFVITSAEMMDSMNMMVSTMMTVLVAIAAISLLVGGIGIMNIMLVSVTERTREIGIRKSLGGKRRDIRSQFIIEAGTTSAIGGIIGIGLGVFLANVASMLVGAIMSASMGGGTFHATPTVSSVAIAFGVSVGIGILFGYLPANKAARLNPIDALRYD